MIILYSRFIIAFFTFFSFELNAQIVINEVSSATVAGYFDEDNSQEDWIEFYNPSASAVNMGGYTITSEEGSKTHTWTFPGIIIKPHDYLTIFCSGKNRT